jgi:methylmalonyl-CoA mutase C-terminal domain/subunit
MGPGRRARALALYNPARLSSGRLAGARAARARLGHALGANPRGLLASSHLNLIIIMSSSSTTTADTQRGKIRVVVAKPGLDGHDRGAKIIARALRDAGMEVIYTGLHQTPEQIVETVIQEDADAVALLREQGIDDVVVTVGGTIPAEDIPELKDLGVAEVFTPGAPTQSIVDFIRASVHHH